MPTTTAKVVCKECKRDAQVPVECSMWACPVCTRVQSVFDTVQNADAYCNALFNKLDAMKAAHLDTNGNAEYMGILKALQAATRSRLTIGR